jgi:outer membrane protein
MATAPQAVRRPGRAAGPRFGLLCGLILLATGAATAQPAAPATSQPGAVPAPSVEEAGVVAGAPDAKATGREAELKPVWEAGIGFTALSLPDYRGSDRSRAYLLPLPYLIYRGPFFSVDRGGIKAELLDRGRLELDFSLNLSVPVRSDGNEARAGMPSLRPALEIGPQLLANLWNSRDGRARLQLQMPLRYAFALSTSTRDAGFIFLPRLGLDVRDFASVSGLNAGFVVGPIFASARQHDYFYTVEPKYATATRPAYQAGGGYSGMQLTMSLSKRFPDYWFGAFLRADWLSGAVFRDSPLVRRNATVAGGIAVSWIFAVSGDRVSRSD